MIELTQNPEALLQLKAHDRCLVQGQLMVVHWYEGEVCLDAADNRTPTEFSLAGPDARYSDYFRHVRVNGVAMMPPQTLVEALRARTFYIG